MWFSGVKKKGKRSIQADDHTLSVQLVSRPEILELHQNDTQLRLWLPEECKAALDDVIMRHKTLGTTYLREFFVAYLYGEHELLRMRDTKTGIYYTDRTKVGVDGIIKYSRSQAAYAIPGLGKNVVPVKIYLPAKMKEDLQATADAAGVALSNFVRELLVSHLFGHTFWPERFRSCSPEEKRLIHAWETGEDSEIVVQINEEEWGDGSTVSQVMIY
jgi:hypothetical protein